MALVLHLPQGKKVKHIIHYLIEEASGSINYQPEPVHQLALKLIKE